jgi:uncharacterized protein involved in exopolysaccharide biosynthesis
VNIDDRLQAASRALRDSSAAQVDAASRLQEIARHSDQPVAHGHTTVLRDEPQESPRPLAPSLPLSGKANAVGAEASVAATPTSSWTDGEARSTFHSQSPSGNAVGRLLRSIWRYKPLIATAVLLGALLGSGWAARQPTLYEGVTRVFLGAGSDLTSLPPGEPEGQFRSQAQFMSSSPVLERAVKRSGSRISVKTLRQRLQVEVAPDADVLTIRVVDSTAKGAAQLADAVAAAYEAVLAQQEAVLAQQIVSQLQTTLRRLQATLTQVDAELADRPDNRALQARRAACAVQIPAVQRQLREAQARTPTRPSVVWQRAAVPQRPITPGPGRAMAVGMLLGLLASAVLVWWLTRRQTSSSSEQGPERPPA